MLNDDEFVAAKQKVLGGWPGCHPWPGEMSSWTRTCLTQTGASPSLTFEFGASAESEAELNI